LHKFIRPAWKLARAGKAAKLKISWRAILYPWKISKKLIELMAKAGCKEVRLGFESGSKKTLQAMN